MIDKKFEDGELKNKEEKEKDQHEFKGELGAKGLYVQAMNQWVVIPMRLQLGPSKIFQIQPVLLYEDFAERYIANPAKKEYVLEHSDPDAVAKHNELVKNFNGLLEKIKAEESTIKENDKVLTEFYNQLINYYNQAVDIISDDPKQKWDPTIEE